MSIAVIAGLGNPGPRYRDTRHNIGFVLVEALAARLRCDWKNEPRFEADTALADSPAGGRLLLVKPLTFMNASGRALGALLRYHRFPVERLLALYDDLTLGLGRTKLSLDGGAGGHNGVADLLEQVGSGFARFRIGIGARPDKRIHLADYVLSRFSADEKRLLADLRPDHLDQIQLVVDKGPVAAMNIINQRTEPQNERITEQ